jgi:aryl-alcohol dehydrogenase-like predicted oxidoreductase
MEMRPLQGTTLKVSVVAFGGWPIAGMASPGVDPTTSAATVAACLDLGINHIDTAFSYGRNGESEHQIGKALGRHRNEMVLATKGGLDWTPEGRQHHDASPATLRRQCETSLRRLKTDHVELYYLHAPDPAIPIAESAGELRKLLDSGKTLSIGVSNLTVAQMEAFLAVCPIAACQSPYNMLQRQIENDTLPWCRSHDIAVIVYWPLMKGLLAGKLRAEQTFENDSRRKYPMFQGDEYLKNLAFVERLRAIAEISGHTVAQLAVNWVIHQPGITAAACGAKRVEQLRDNAGAADWRLSEEEIALVDRALADRGLPNVRVPV